MRTDLVHLGWSLARPAGWIRRFLVTFCFLSSVSSLVGSFAWAETSALCTDRPVLHERVSNSRLDRAFAMSPRASLSHLLGHDPTPTERYVAKLYLRLTGAPTAFLSPRFQRAVSLVDAGDVISAAKLITTEKNFLGVRVRNFAAPFTNKDFSTLEPFNDLQALIIGVTRDELDARLILTGNIRYSGFRGLGLPAVSLANNDHYAQFESMGLDLQRDLERVDNQWDGLDLGGGAFTTRAWAKAHYDAGTNRRAVKYALDVFLCEPIDTWKIRGLPDYYVRRDVERNVGGDPAEFQNRCRNCHAAMDGMAGAFAKLDFVNNRFIASSTDVRPKYNQNTTVYPAGFVTTDDSWINLLGNHPSIDFGWRGPLEGTGVLSFATSLANSKAFSRCMAARVFKEVCGQAIQDAAPDLFEPLMEDFEQQSYNMKYLFAKVATLEQCVSRAQ